MFPLLICAFLCGPTLLYCTSEAGIDIPYDLTAKPATYLEGNQHDVDLAEYASIESFTSGKLQSAAKTKLDNFTPARATAITFNAALQRTMIKASNALINQDCYPTYFGSGRIYLPEANALSYAPGTMGSYAQNSWQAFAEGVREAAIRHPEKRFLIYVIGGYYEPAYNPVYELVPFPARPDLCVAIMKSALQDCPNATVLTRAYTSAESYYRDFFRTDHHWNIAGAFAAYEQIVDAFDLEAISPGGKWEIPNFRFTGATARWGIDLLSETVFDANEDFAMLTATRTDGTVINCSDHTAFWDAEPLSKHYSFYDLYYDRLYDCTITGGIGTRSALLVANSYRGAIQRPLAYSYKSLTINFQLHPSSKVTSTLEEQIDAANADDVLFVANPGNLNVDSAYWK